MTNIDLIKDVIAYHDIKIIDFYFTDIKGKWFHFSYSLAYGLKLLQQNGSTFDGSSIEGWCEVNKSDMVMKPDIKTAFVDPFATKPTLNIICNIIDPYKEQNYEFDPRSIAIKAMDYLKETKIADDVLFGPEPEFFIFDEVNYANTPLNSFIKINADEFAYNNAGVENKYLNTAYRCENKKGYMITEPVDKHNNIRSEILELIREIGINPELHHHEVSPAQSEIGFAADNLLKTCDNIQKFKYVTKNIAASYGKTASFMPKPIHNENGNGMHIHQSLWKDGKNLFAGDKYAGLSDLSLHYIAGIIKHAKTINAFANPTINSYKRLVPGFEAPVKLTYSAANRSAAIRIPYVLDKQNVRMEARFPDPSANPYLCCAAMLMAGIDGIENKLEPGQATEQNVYDEQTTYDNLSINLGESLDNLAENHQFLLKNNVFSANFIKKYIEMKKREITEINLIPHPKEFELYYNC